MKQWSKAVAGMATLALAAGSTAALAGQSRFTTLSRGTRMWHGDNVIAQVAPTKPMHVMLSLKLRNEARLNAFLANPNHAILTPAQFRARFSPTAAQARAVANFLKRSGFRNVRIAPNRLLVSANGSAASVQSSFHTELMTVYTRDGRTAYANTNSVKIPSSLKGTVEAVLGLQNVHMLHTTLVYAKNRTNGLSTQATTGHNPTQFPSIYGAGSAPTGAGVSVGIVTEGSLTNIKNDLAQFTSNNGLASVTTQTVNTNGTSSDTSGDGEWDLDSQDIVGMAGGQIGKIIFYNIPSLSDSNLTADFNAIVNANAVKVINVSLGECETTAQSDGSAASDDNIFKQADAQGQTFSVSSGDSGADECSNGGTTPSWPASSQYVVAVGGTTLSTSGGSYAGETAWSKTGGSPSTFEPIPSWQKGVGQNGSSSYRGVPDIAFDADPNSGALVIVDGAQQQIGGTSLASPLFVGTWARVIAAKGTSVGFAAPLIYQLPSSAFHDVTSGSNGGETAAVGWDYTTGFGSMIVANVVSDIGGSSGGGGGGGGNAVPTASNGSVTTNENTAVNGTLSASDSDGDALTFSIVSQPSHGSVTITNTSTGAFTYTPNSNYYGSDSFTFKATDSAGQASNTATESVTVNQVSTNGCASGFTKYTGSVSQGNDSYQPNGNYYNAGAGYERGRLTGPSGTDFDLYLYQYSYYYGWQTVDSSTGNTSSESIDYNGSSGYYIWDIYAYSGSGNYTFCLQHP